MSLHMIGPGKLSPETVNAVVQIRNIESKDVRSDGWEGKDAALQFIVQCIQAYRH